MCERHKNGHRCQTLQAPTCLPHWIFTFSIITIPDLFDCLWQPPIFEEYFEIIITKEESGKLRYINGKIRTLLFFCCRISVILCLIWGSIILSTDVSGSSRQCVSSVLVEGNNWLRLFAHFCAFSYCSSLYPIFMWYSFYMKDVSCVFMCHWSVPIEVWWSEALLYIYCYFMYTFIYFCDDSYNTSNLIRYIY